MPIASGDSKGKLPHAAAPGWKPYQLQVMMVLLGINIMEGLNNQLLAVCLPAIAKDWGISPAHFKLAITTGFLGAALGTPLGGILGDRFGRKPVVLGGALTFSLATLLTCLSSTPEQLFLIRLVAGVCVGICFAPLYTLLVECVHPHQRGMAMGLTLVSVPIGITMSGLMVTYMLPALGWRVVFLIAGGLCLAASLIGVVGLTESPVYLARKPATRAAAARLVARLGLTLEEQTTQPDARVRLSLGAIMRGGGRLSVTFGLMGAMFSIYLLMGLVLGWMPSFLTTHHLPITLAGSAISCWSFSGMAGMLLVGVAITRIGAVRSFNLINGFGTLAMIALGLFALVINILAPSGLAVFFLLLGLAGLLMNGAISALITSAAETFPSAIRSSGMGLVSTAGKTGAIFGAYGGAITLSFGTLSEFFLSAAVPALVALVLFNLHRLEGAAHPL